MHLHLRERCLPCSMRWFRGCLHAGARSITGHITCNADVCFVAICVGSISCMPCTGSRCIELYCTCSSCIACCVPRAFDDGAKVCRFGTRALNAYFACDMLLPVLCHFLLPTCAQELSPGLEDQRQTRTDSKCDPQLLQLQHPWLAVVGSSEQYLSQIQKHEFGPAGDAGGHNQPLTQRLLMQIYYQALPCANETTPLALAVSFCVLTMMGASVCLTR